MGKKKEFGGKAKFVTYVTGIWLEPRSINLDTCQTWKYFENLACFFESISMECVSEEQEG